MANKIHKILLIGPQASGKGTQAEMLSQKYNLPVFSTGNILRQQVAKGDDLGKQVAEIINKGRLAPDDLGNKIIAEKIKSVGGQGYILDGYPRNLSQANFLAAKDKLTHVFEIYISDKEAVRRISERRTCSKCQTVYHLKYNPPKSEGVCDKDGEALIIRADEREEVVKTRLKNYHQLTEPLLEFYQEQGVYHKINGEQSILKVSEDILKMFK